MEDMAVTCAFLDQCFAVAHERILHYARGEELAADIDLYLLAGRGRDAREADPAWARTCRWSSRLRRRRARRLSDGCAARRDLRARVPPACAARRRAAALRAPRGR